MSTGGPGTKKGRIVSDLVQSFGFKLINVENMIQEEFSKQLEDPDPEKLTMAVHQMIKVSMFSSFPKIDKPEELSVYILILTL